MSQRDRGSGPLFSHRRPVLDRDAVVATAIGLARSDGLSAVSMRRVADLLAASPMSLYRHVSDREDLLLGMLDVVAAEVGEVPTQGAPGDRLIEIMTVVHRALRRDPWVVQILAIEGLASPLILPVTEAGFAALAEAGLPPHRARAAYALLFEYLYGEVLVFHHDQADSRSRRMVHEADADRYPHLAMVVADVTPGDPRDYFAENLRRLVDSILTWR